MNKNLLLGIVAVVLSVFALQAQDHKYGFRMGLNYSDIDFDDDTTGVTDGDEGDARIGFTAGFFAQYYLSDKISIQPELQYSAQGERSKIGGDRLRINVLQLPVLFNYHISKLTLSAGPQVGIRIWEWERRDDYEAILFSGVAGISYDITDNIQAALRGSFGFTDPFKTDDTSAFNASGLNHYLQFTLAYRF